MGIIFVFVFFFGILGLMAFLGLWQMFRKAGEPPYVLLIPIYNAFTFLKIANRPFWWIMLFFVPLLSVIAYFLVHISLAKNFGKNTVYGIAMAFFPFVFYLILGFGNAQYKDNIFTEDNINSDILDAGMEF